MSEDSQDLPDLEEFADRQNEMDPLWIDLEEWDEDGDLALPELNENGEDPYWARLGLFGRNFDEAFVEEEEADDYSAELPSLSSSPSVEMFELEFEDVQMFGGGNDDEMDRDGQVE